MSSSSGLSAGFDDPGRLRLITAILESLRSAEMAMKAPLGTLEISTPIWFALWLADLSELARISQDFSHNAMGTLLQYNGGSFDRLLTIMRPSHIPGLPRFSIGGKVATSRPDTGIASPSRRIEGFLPSKPTESCIGAVPATMENSPAKQFSKKRKHEEMEPPSSPSIPSTSKVKRDPTKDCLERDRVCVISRATDPLQAAHILPASLSDITTSIPNMQYYEFKDLLAIFWSERTIEKWLQAKEDIFLSAINPIALSPSCHVYWDRALFGLMPVGVSEDRTSMQLQFFRLNGQGLPATGNSLLLPPNAEGNAMIAPLTMPGKCQQGGRDHHVNVAGPNLTIFDHQAQRIIPSGDIVTITTTDPSTLPLPDEGLLSLQWTLHRLVALCAAAGWQPGNTEDDDEIYPDQLHAMSRLTSEEAGHCPRMREIKRLYFEERIAEARDSWNIDYGY
ncbi:HNH endonuclease signature motif containing protein [Aspergillus ibericus CBS 121593]|uniref:HNH nuclease domain-containing protein n=1 Tax=Aspergillus ibericus CBS 121593 TaxID=1448316 RepID=A0A395H3Y3_9EURO|nr:hypothetical protein BO80DRAFT_472020 [Aspergillus ibericus CBS 121593]RAL02621.1 hypothetical protein BO80DRAFT_472020 [Aspergillus ibericus CBS 121593]